MSGWTALLAFVTLAATAYVYDARNAPDPVRDAAATAAIAPAPVAPEPAASALSSRDPAPTARDVAARRSDEATLASQ